MFENLRSKLPRRKGLMGINGRNLELIYPHNRRENFVNVDDKLRCKEILAEHGLPVAETYHVITGPHSLSTWEDAVAGRRDFVVKPNDSYGGNGIALIRRDDSGYYAGSEPVAPEDITFHIKLILNGAFTRDNMADIAFIEQKLECHPDVLELIPAGSGGVADIRLIYRHEKVVMAMMRLPTGESGGRANLHQGGIGLGIDLQTGLTTDGCYKNKVIQLHHETGLNLSGRSVPHFFEMVEHGRRISEIVGLGYIGVDFVADANLGPVILEVNARPGLNIQIANQKGLRRNLL